MGKSALELIAKASDVYGREGVRTLSGKVSRYIISNHLPETQQRVLLYPDDFKEYENPPDPFAAVSVDPKYIERFTGRPYPPYHQDVGLGTVRGGNWDERDRPEIVDPEYEDRYELYRAETFSEGTFYQSLESHFVEGVDWRETEFVRRCLSLAADGRPSWHSATSAEEILERCRKIDELYDDIRENGYRSQRELGHDSIETASKEVNVDIGRDGDFLFVNGRHRLALAKILDVESIPVGVIVRHRKWMKYRDKIAGNERIPDHPDLRDLRADRRQS